MHIEYQHDLINMSSAPLIKCGDWEGTATVIGKDIYETDSHVIRGTTKCTIDDKKLNIVFNDPRMDTAFLTGPTDNRLAYKVNCDGFRKGGLYFASGWAYGEDETVDVLVANGTYEETIYYSDIDQQVDNVAVLTGRVVSGMSGGPIVDMNGNLVGLILAYELDPKKRLVEARELKSTPLCKIDK